MLSLMMNIGFLSISLLFEQIIRKFMYLDFNKYD